MSPATRTDGCHLIGVGRHDGEALAETLDALAERVARYRVEDRTIVYCNASWAAAHNATPPELVGRCLDELLAPEELDGLAVQLSRLGVADPLIADDMARPSPHEPGRWVAWVDRYMPGPDGPQVLAVGRDVTDRHLAEVRLAESEARFRELAEQSPDVVWHVRLEPGPDLDYLSPSIYRLTGYSPAELQGDVGRFVEILDEGALALVRAAMLGQPIPPQFDARLRHREGHVVIVELHVTVLPDGLQGTAREVTEIRALQAELAAQALHDPLTGLANRNLLHEVLTLGRQSAKRSGAPLALIYLDLDDFKAVNDSYGHEAGDVVLRETARRLLSTVREADVVARVGGDEFVVVHESSGDSTNLVVRRLEQALSEPIDVGNGVLVCCVPSMGIADALTVGRDPSALIAAADAAMYRVKRARRAEWCSAGVNTAGSGVDRGPPARGD